MLQEQLLENCVKKKAFGVSITELISGNAVNNAKVSANMLRSKFYVCPVCGNVFHCMGEAYELNKTYADDKVAFSEYLKELREEVRKDTLKKMGE